MAAALTTCPGFLATDADYQAFVQAYEAALLTGGALAHTAGVTGEINPATVARPAVNTDAGYRIYEFADSLQATAPIFVRVLYGTSGAADRPRLTFTLGHSVSLATGAITGTRLIGPVSLQVAGSTVAGPNGRTILASGSASASRIAVFSADQSSSNTGVNVVIERLKALDGQPSAAGVYFATHLTSASNASYAVLWAPAYAQTAFSPVSGLVAVATFTGNIWSGGGNVLLLPIQVPGAPDWFSVESLLCSMGGSAGISPGVPISVPHLGAVRSYMPLAASQSGASAMGPANSQSLLIWQ